MFVARFCLHFWCTEEGTLDIYSTTTDSTSLATQVVWRMAGIAGSSYKVPVGTAFESSVTSMFPSMAFEYGQNAWARSAN
jgi:hypothetical protein